MTRYSEMSDKDKATVRGFFRQHLKWWKAYWGDLPDMERIRTFWNWSKWDTLR